MLDKKYYNQIEQLHREGLGYRRIAKELGLKAGTVKGILKRLKGPNEAVKSIKANDVKDIDGKIVEMLKCLLDGISEFYEPKIMYIEPKKLNAWWINMRDNILAMDEKLKELLIEDGNYFRINLKPYIINLIDWLTQDSKLFSIDYTFYEDFKIKFNISIKRRCYKYEYREWFYYPYIDRNILIDLANDELEIHHKTYKLKSEEDKAGIEVPKALPKDVNGDKNGALNGVKNDINRDINEDIKDKCRGE